VENKTSRKLALRPINKQEEMKSAPSVSTTGQGKITAHGIGEKVWYLFPGEGPVILWERNEKCRKNNKFTEPEVFVRTRGAMP